MTARPGRAYDAACRRAVGALRDRRRLDRADVLALLDGQRDARERDRAALALARAGLLGRRHDLRELFAGGAAALPAPLPHARRTRRMSATFVASTATASATPSPRPRPPTRSTPRSRRPATTRGSSSAASAGRRELDLDRHQRAVDCSGGSVEHTPSPPDPDSLKYPETKVG
jgi:hypothetical protein